VRHRRTLFAVALAALALIVVACAPNASQDTLKPAGPYAEIPHNLYVPVFFVASGLRFDVQSIKGFAELERAGLFFVILVAVRTVPTVLYRPYLSWRECLASGLLLSTNLSFIVVSVAVGAELGHIREINATALILAGLVSALVLPTVASLLLRGSTEPATADGHVTGIYTESL